ncbi:MAG: Aldehyde dehydrogenase B, partial [uncultured Rubrobacteraceae bacterium]
AGQAALHLQDAGRGGGDHHGRELPRGRTFLVPDPGAHLRQRGRLEARRVLPRRRRRPGQTLPGRRPPRRRP